ncbi:MAG: hypothetical protein AAF192_02350 [Pseudomonadota bacterium]
MDFLWDVASETFWPGLFVGLLLTSRFLLHDLVESPKSLRFVLDTVLEASWRGRYRGLLKGALSSLDRRLSRGDMVGGPLSRRRAWSLGLLNATLVFAFAYPVVTLLVNWGVWNNGQIAGLTLAPPLEEG